MKKLKGWQIALLVIFYPAGIVYLLVWLVNRSKTNTNATAAEWQNAVKASDLRVLRDFRTKVVGVTFGNDGSSLGILPPTWRKKCAKNTPKTRCRRK